MSRKYNRNIHDAVMEVPFKKSHSHDKSRYYNGFSAD